MEKTPSKNTPKAEKKPKEARSELRGTERVKTITTSAWGWLIAKAGILLAWCAAVLLAAQFVIQFLGVWILGGTTAEQTLPMAIMMALSYGLAFAVLLYLTPKVTLRGKGKLKEMMQSKEYVRNVDIEIYGKTANREELGLRGWPTWTDIGLSIVGFVVAMMGAMAIMAVFSGFSWFDTDQEQNIGFSTSVIGAERIVVFVGLAIFVPIMEELIFRGWLYGKLRRMFGKKTPAWAGLVISILLTSVLFGAMHGQWNVGIVTFVMSVVMCILREMTGTIYAGILVHIFKNTWALYQLYVLGI